VCIAADGVDNGDDVVDSDSDINRDDDGNLFSSAKFVTVRQLLSFPFVLFRSMVMVEHILKRSYRFPTT